MEYGNICISCFQKKAGDVCENCGYIESGERRRSLLPARTLLKGKYLVGELININQTSIDYKAFDTEKERIVEIQEYFPGDVVVRDSDSLEVVVASSENLNSYQKNLTSIEANGKKMINFSESPYILNYFDCFFENNTVYIVKEYIEGMLLDDFVKSNGGTLDTETALSIMVPVLDGLNQLHKEGLIHRGLTPKSIILTVNNEIKIANFRFLKEASPYKDEAMTVHFTPGYAPSEQYKSKSKQGPFSDIYSAGAILYKILTGKKPTDSLDRMAGDELVPPNELNPDIPENVSLSIMKAMNMMAELRFKTATDFKKCLTEKKDIYSIDDELKTIKKNRIRNAVVISACVLVATVAIVLYIIFG